MANGFRGEQTVETEKGRLTLVFDANAFCEIEDVLSTPERQVGMEEILGLIGKGMSMKAFRAILAGGLRKHHQMSLEEVGELISEVGFDTLGKAVGEALMKAMPSKQAKGGNGTARKRSPGAGQQR